MRYFYNVRRNGIPLAINHRESACLHTDTPRSAYISRTLATMSSPADSGLHL